MKLGILTSVETRHRYFAQAVCRRLEVVAVAYEDTGYTPANAAADDLAPGGRLVVAEHFAERARQEEAFFGDAADFITPDEKCAVVHLLPGTLKSPDTLAFLESAGVDAVVVFGTNLIRPPLLERWPGRMINMHLGLSPYYRGTATNFYPLLNEEPEYVGATIHLIDAGIDSGPIFRHARPDIVADDRPHTIGCKAIRAGIEAMIVVLNAVKVGSVTPVPQWSVPHARVYRRKDYHPRQVVELYRKLEGGMIQRYVRNARRTAGHIRLIE